MHIRYHLESDNFRDRRGIGVALAIAASIAAIDFAAPMATPIVPTRESHVAAGPRSDEGRAREGAYLRKFRLDDPDRTGRNPRIPLPIPAMDGTPLRSTLELWSNGLFDATTYAEHSQLLAALADAVGRAARIEIDSRTRETLNRAIMESLSPSEAQDLLVQGRGSIMFQHLVTIATMNVSTLARDVPSSDSTSASEKLTDAQATQELLRELSTTRSEVTAILERSKNSSDSTWSGLLEQLAPASLANALLAIIIGEVFKRALSWGGRRVRRFDRFDAGSDAEGTTATTTSTDPGPHGSDAALEHVVHDRVISAVKREGPIPRIGDNEMNDLLMLTMIATLAGGTIERAQKIVIAGVAGALAEQNGIRDPLAVADQISERFTRLLAWHGERPSYATELTEDWLVRPPA